MVHELKTDHDVFRAVRNRSKKYEIRFNDRDYRFGDTLILKETVHTGEEMRDGAPLQYTGESEMVVVTHILHGPIYGLQAGWVIMSIN